MKWAALSWFLAFLSSALGENSGVAYGGVNCLGAEMCELADVICDSRLSADCHSGGVYSSRGAGPSCCCPVCYRPEGSRCNDFRICDPKLVCREGFCRRKRYF